MKTIKLFPQHLLLILLLFACSKEEEDEAGVVPQGFFAKVNGEPFEVTQEFVTAEVTTEADGQYSFFIGAYDYENINTSEGKVVALGFYGSDFNNMKAGTSFGSYDISTGNGFIGLYIDTETYGSYISNWLGTVDEDNKANFQIVSIDKDRQTISGEFFFDSYDEDSDKRHQITDGRFSKIAYTIED